MANTYILNISQDVVTMGRYSNLGINFSTENGYVYSNPDYAGPNFTFTKTLLSPSLTLYQETDKGIAYTQYSQLYLREAIGPSVPISGPFIENYSVNGDIDTSKFINLLLIDKPPIRTGTFNFFIGPISFSGTITKQTQYTQYNWSRVGSIYTYVENTNPLGYGIEISKNLLYDVSVVDGSYVYTPTELLNFLRTLNGNEEITSSATTTSPAASTGIAAASLSTSLPITLFYISPADALRYIASYPNLIALYGSDYTKGQIDYANNNGTKTITFDPIAYLNKYPDVRQQYGYDTYNATIDYITTGYSQGRTADASTVNPLTGGLYDERYGAVSLASDLVIWPQGETIGISGGSFTYRFNTTSYSINNNVPVTGNVKYLGLLI
jgi:hypothetical protein